MADTSAFQNIIKLSDQATLGLLSVLETEETPTQRTLANRIGVALGLTNSLLKRCINKGLVKVSQAPTKRFRYYVTPKGFSEKSRLVAEYLTVSLSFFRQAKDEYGLIFKKLKLQGHKRFALYGLGELTEIAQIVAKENDIELVCVIQFGSNQNIFGSLKVKNSIDAKQLDLIDGVIITCANAPQNAYDLMSEHMDESKIYAPSLLHISHTKKNENSS